MKKFFLIFFLISGCINSQTVESDNLSNVEFSDNLSFNQFKERLEIYANNSPYPNIDD